MSNDALMLIQNAHEKFALVADAIVDPTRDTSIYVGDGGESDIQLAQINLWRWQRRNFGLPTFTMYACGVLEECAEYGDATIIEDTIKRRAAMVDAFGDICIYSCNFATALELDFEMLFKSDATVYEGRMRQFCHAALKSEQKSVATPSRRRAAWSWARRSRRSLVSTRDG